VRWTTDLQEQTRGNPEPKNTRVLPEQLGKGLGRKVGKDSQSGGSEDMQRSASREKFDFCGKEKAAGWSRGKKWAEKVIGGEQKSVGKLSRGGSSKRRVLKEKSPDKRQGEREGNLH